MQENEVKAPETEPQVTKSPDRAEHTHVPSPGRHERKCNICNHSDRAAIEFDFINWRNPAELVKSFQLRDLSTIYRHAHATGLFARRRLNLRGLMERIAERVSEVPITAAAIIRAARAIAHINDAGEWIDPPTRVIVEHHYHSKRKNGSVTIKKVSHAMFTPANLDEPSPEAASRGERPRVDPKSRSQFPTEVVLEIAPALYEASMERKRRGEAALLAKEAKQAALAAKGEGGIEAVSGTGSQPVEDSSLKSVAASSSNDQTVAASSPLPATSRKGTASAVPLSATGNPSLLPQAAVNHSAPTALSVHESRATEHASRPSGLVARAGSAGSTNPPFPFDPSKQLYRKGRRHRL